MVDLAERFISKALSILQYTSPTMTGWKTNMQNVYAHILRIKSDSKKSIPSDTEYLNLIDDFNFKNQNFTLLLPSDNQDKESSLSVKMFT
jgi:hypothetical protein